MRSVKLFPWIALLLIIGCVHDPLIIPENPGDLPIPGCTTDGTVCFESSVLPIFVSECAQSKCHSVGSHREGFVLNNYSNIVSKGIRPGNAAESELYEVLLKSGEDAMPPDNPLTQAQKDTIALWINQGANNTTDCNCYCDASQFSFAEIIEPMINLNCVGCHKPGTLSGDIDLSTYSAIKVQVDNGKLLGSVTQATSFSPMPKGGKLSDCEIAQVISWIDVGAPNN